MQNPAPRLRKVSCSGGGVALLRSIKALEKLKVHNDDQRTGIEIKLRRRSRGRRAKSQLTLVRMVRSSLVRFWKKTPTPSAMTRRPASVGNLVSKGIIDPTKVVRIALQGAAPRLHLRVC